MPMLLSQALFNLVKNDELALKLASSGFRDMTRLAMSNIDMAVDMVTLNSANIKHSLEKLNESLLDIENDYTQKIERIRDERSKMYDKDGKNIL